MRQTTPKLACFQTCTRHKETGEQQHLQGVHAPAKSILLTFKYFQAYTVVLHV